MTQRRLRPLFALLTVLLGLFLFNQNVQAAPILQGDTVQNDETINNDVFLNGENIVVDGAIEGDLFAVGNNITINGTVEGSVVAIGQNITVNGKVDGSVYATGVTFTLGEDARIRRSLYWIGVHLGLKKGSEIEWDLNGFMLSARLAGRVGRDIKASIGILDLIQFFLNTTDSEFEGVLLPENNQLVTIPTENSVVSKDDLTATKLPAATNTTQTAQQQAANATGQEMLITMLTQYVSLLIVAGILAWLFPKKLDAWSNQARRFPLLATGQGFMGYFVGFIATFFLITFVFALGLGLFKFNLNELAMLTYGIGFSSIALGFSLFIALIAFVSKVIVAYVVGTMILEKLLPAATRRRVFPLLLGLIIFVLLRAIPYFGWITTLIVTWMGMATVWMSWQANRNGDTAVSIPPTTPEEAAQIPTSSEDPPPALEAVPSTETAEKGN